MPVAASELRAPKGDIEDSLFPGESSTAISARLQGYLDEGYVKAAAENVLAAKQDAAAKAWAYHRAYRAIYVRLTANPSSISLNDQGSSSFLVTQIENMKQLADSALAVFWELVPEEVKVAREEIQPSSALATRITW